MTNQEAIKNVVTFGYMVAEQMPSDVAIALDIMKDATEKQSRIKKLLEAHEDITRDNNETNYELLIAIKKIIN